jgi:hypothetical protein
MREFCDMVNDNRFFADVSNAVHNPESVEGRRMSNRINNFGEVARRKLQSFGELQRGPNR